MISCQWCLLVEIQKNLQVCWKITKQFQISQFIETIVFLYTKLITQFYNFSWCRLYYWLRQFRPNQTSFSFQCKTQTYLNIFPFYQVIFCFFFLTLIIIILSSLLFLVWFAYCWLFSHFSFLFSCTLRIVYGHLGCLKNGNPRWRHLKTAASRVLLKKM